MHRRVDQALWSVHLSEALLRTDRIDDARRNAQNAIQLARQHGERGNEAHALRIQGEALSRGFDDGQALDHYQAALQLAEALNMRPLIAQCRFGLGKFWQGCGKRHEAEAALPAATTMYRDMGMHFWLKQAEAALIEVRAT
jgi:tetratricopeptide (TPR) repeat protein